MKQSIQDITVNSVDLESAVKAYLRLKYESTGQENAYREAGMLRAFTILGLGNILNECDNAYLRGEL